MIDEERKKERQQRQPMRAPKWWPSSSGLAWVGWLEGEDEAGEGVASAVGAAALPDALGGGGGGEARDGEVGVEVLAQLGDHPIAAHRPGVHPVGLGGLVVHALGDDGGAEGVDGARLEDEGGGGR
ncbi:hypothetical protein D1007_33275 [Hordeum vulgare]|nr:hypothetical protein D1007_33275 [Hordeum vulgare]